MANSTALKTYRLNRNWSQEQLAEMSGLSVRTIQRIEQGKRAGLESWKSLSAVFEIPIAELQGDLVHSSGDSTMTSSSTTTDHYYCQRQQPGYSCPPPQQVEQSQSMAASPPKHSAELSQEEARALRDVRRLRKFYIDIFHYVVVIAGLAILNWFTTPNYWWVLWPAAAWGIALLLSGLTYVAPLRIFDTQWERREVEKRLNKRL